MKSTFSRKEIKLTFDHMALELECDPDSGIVIMRLQEIILNEEKSTPNRDYYETKNTVEVYPDTDEINEIIKALQNILPEEEKQNEPIGFCGK
jgi:hypothetical protein